MSNRAIYKTVDEAYHGATDEYDGAFGQWLSGLWGWTPTLPIQQQREIFFALLERLLREGKVVLSPPEEFWREELGAYEAPMRPAENFIGIWDVPIEEQIFYIREHFPKDVTDVNDKEIVFYFHGNYCPRIGWVHPETGEIVAS